MANAHSSTERTFAEILKREDQLISRTEQVLQELGQIREQINPMLEAGHFEIEYRQSVVRSFDILQLLGVDVTTANRRHRLSVAYITLTVTHERARSSSLMSRFSLEKQNNVSNTTPQKIKRDTVPVDVALIRSRCLLIRGLAGSGKTTLLQWIAVKSASRSFDGYLASWNKTIPFYIRLRHCLQTGLPRPEEFPGLVAPAIANKMPKGWVHRQLESGLAIVLIDGVDEIPTKLREYIRMWLKELVQTYPRAHFIITSRPHAIEEGWLDDEEFSDAELQPMQLSDIYSFIDHWHNAVREELHENEEKIELKALSAYLKNAVRYSSSIRNLATNPLLCAMLCALNRKRKQQIPADRIELYEACCKLLLEERDRVRDIDLSDYPTLNYRQKLLLLEDIAYWMIKNGWSEVSVPHVDERITRKLINMPSIAPDISAVKVRQLFTERTHIIREPIVGHIDFAHRTFQEFLASKAAAEEIDIGLLVEKAHDDQWREVIILTAGHASKQMREELIRDLVNRGDNEKQYQHRFHLLAVSCLETSVELAQEVSKNVEERLGKLVPPRNMPDAEALAVAGEMVIKYLTRKKEHIASIRAACVHALARIGSEISLETLTEYALDEDQLVIDELIKTWDSFDRQTYAERILAQALRNKPNLKLERLFSLDGFQYFKALTSLELSNCPQISDLAPLASLTQLRSLHLDRCSKLSDLAPLAGLIQLDSLALSDCPGISSLASLMTLFTLTGLNLSNCKNVSNFYPLSQLGHLRWLNLYNCIGLRDLTFLQDLHQLRWLNLSGCSQVSDLTLLSKLSNLQELGLVGIRHKVFIPKGLEERVKIFQ